MVQMGQGTEHGQFSMYGPQQPVSAQNLASYSRDRLNRQQSRGYSALGSQGLSAVAAVTNIFHHGSGELQGVIDDQTLDAEVVVKAFERQFRDRSDQGQVRGYNLHGQQGIASTVHNSAGFTAGRVDHECVFVDHGGFMWHKGFCDDEYPFKVYDRDGAARTLRDGTVTHAVRNNPKYDTAFDPNLHHVEFIPIRDSNPLMYAYNSVRSFVPGDQHSGRHYIGPCDRECVHCHAMLWPGEYVGQCCMHGKVYVPPLSHPFPPRLMELFTCIPCVPQGSDVSSARLKQLKRDHNLFMSQWRVINANLSFASFNTNVISVPGRGPPLFKVGGLITCNISSPAVRIPRKGVIAKPPVFSQMYFIDTAEAKQVLRQNQTCKNSQALHLINEIHELLRSQDEHNSRGILAPINAIAELIMSMKEVEEEYKQQGKAVPLIKIRFNTGKNINPKTHNPPSKTNDIGALIVGDAGDGIKVPGLCICNKASDVWSELHAHNPLIDAMIYQLFVPRGDSGYHWNTLCAGQSLPLHLKRSFWRWRWMG